MNLGIVRDSNEWSFETQVVIVGSGGCGLTAGIAAAKNGAEAIILEKQAKPWSNTARSGGMIPAAGTRFQKQAGIIETADDFAEDILKKNKHASDAELTLHLTQTATRMVEWLVDEVNVELSFIDDFKYPGHSEFRMHAPPNRTGAALVADLRRAVHSNKNAEFIADSPVVGVVVDDVNHPLGVIVQRGESQERVRCQKLILACNGFAGNKDMIAEYCPKISNAIYFGGEGNTGEGILWGMELGADVAFMDAYQAHASIAVQHGILITYAIIMEGGFQVNSHGARFGNESTGYSEHALAVLEQPGGVAWDIYDRKLHLLGLQFDDYVQAVEAGAIFHADSIEELAETLKLPQGDLTSTLIEYNTIAAGNGRDPFGRQDSKILEAPFYGTQVTGALFHTQGGLKVDTNARVLDKVGGPIPNLYAGGGVAAGLSGYAEDGYLSGNGLLTALGYGMLAGEHAAKSIRAGD